jgi:hypothetical protein
MMFSPYSAKKDLLVIPIVVGILSSALGYEGNTIT